MTENERPKKLNQGLFESTFDQNLKMALNITLRYVTFELF